MLNDDISIRARETGEYVAATGATVRAAAKMFGVSKSTVHKDLAERLKTVDGELYEKVCRILEKNRAERHLRGGMATKLKYSKEKVDNGGYLL